MSNTKQYISTYPTVIQEMFKKMIESKDDYMKKVSTAGRHKLAFSYERLIDIYQQNNLDKLQSDLEKTNQELLTISTKAESDLKAKAANLKIQYGLSIENRRTQLKKKKIALEELKRTLRANKNARIEFTSIWKNDIVTKLKASTEKKESLLSNWAEKKLNYEQKLKDLSDKLDSTKPEVPTAEANWNESIENKKMLLKKILSKKENLSLTLNQELKTCQKNLAESLTSKTQSWMEKSEVLMQRLNEFQEKETNLKSDLITFEANLKNKLRLIQQNSSKELKEEIMRELQSYPPELRNYCESEDGETMLRIENKYLEDLKALNNYLSRKASKIGLKVEELLKVYDENAFTNPNPSA